MLDINSYVEFVVFSRCILLFRDHIIPESVGV